MSTPADACYPPTDTWHPPRDLAAVPHARRRVEKFLAGLGYTADTIYTVALIVDELLGNAIRHGRPDIKVTVSVFAGCVCGVVTDHGAGVPELKPPSKSAETGRGLAIVEEFATEWHVEPLAGGPGKRVLFTYCGSEAA